MATKPKNFRFQPATIHILNAVVNATNSNDSRVAELCIAKHALEIGVETVKARQFLFDNLMLMISTNSIHAHRPGSVSAQQYLADLHTAWQAVQRMHTPTAKTKQHTKG